MLSGIGRNDAYYFPVFAIEKKDVVATSKVEALEAKASGLWRDLIIAMDAHNTSKE